MTFETRRIAGAPDAIAPDGSEVRVLCGLSRGGLAVFSLRSGSVSKAVTHRTVEEIWYVLSGRGGASLAGTRKSTRSMPACRSAYLPARDFNFAATVRSR